MSKIQELKNGTKMVVIPKVLCDVMGWNKGDSLEWRVSSKCAVTVVRSEEEEVKN
jgi:bifunctional DNA-binding transcriptional regulator/antitoxin component of YhaV-PrlF toxin-antitoxin module